MVLPSISIGGFEKFQNYKLFRISFPFLIKVSCFFVSRIEHKIMIYFSVLFLEICPSLCSLLAGTRDTRSKLLFSL